MLGDAGAEPGALSLDTLEEAERYLEGLINLERRSDWPYSRLGLEPIRALLALAEHPERDLRVIHIAGSKGKGSTALLVESLLGAAGHRVGTFTSPHLESFVERFRVGGCEVAGDDLARVLSRLRPHIDTLRRAQPENAPSFFDALCAAALMLFAEASVDWCVLEVGLGGRLDSTNAVAPERCCITSIELEHTEVLGDTLEAIAAEKAGILKAGVPLVLGWVPDPAAGVILERATKLEVPVIRAGVDFGFEAPDSDEERALFRMGGEAMEFSLPVPGRHHARNAALAIALVGDVLHLGAAELSGLVERAFSTLSLPARAECLGRDPLVVVDAAHTAASARALAETLERLGAEQERVHFVLSVSVGKDLDAILSTWLPFASRFTLTRALAARSHQPEELARVIQRLRPGCDLRIEPDPERALRSARDALAPGEALCATGSFFLAGIARRALRPG